MKVLITGNGYIANRFETILKDEYDITKLTRKDVDLCDTESVNEWFYDKYFDVVIHTAIRGGSRLIVDDYSVISDNITMFFNLVSHSDKFKRLINLGSGAEINNPYSPYGFSKKTIHDYVTASPYMNSIRIYGVFDENELDSRFIKSNIQRYINKKPMVIHNDIYFDFIYMADLVELVKVYVNSNDILPDVSASYPTKRKLTYVASIINEQSDYTVDVDVHFKYNEHDVSDYSCPCDYVVNLKNELNLSNMIGLEDGIRETYKKILNGTD